MNTDQTASAVLRRLASRVRVTRRRWGGKGVFLVVALIGATGSGAGAQYSSTPTSPVPQPTLQMTNTSGTGTTGVSSGTMGQSGTLTSQTGTRGQAGSQNTSVGRGGMQAPGGVKGQGPGAQQGKGVVQRGVQVIRSKGAPAVTHGSGAFEPTLANPVDYGEEPPAGGQLLTIASPGAPQPVTEFLDQLVMATGWNVVTSPGIEGKTIRFWVNKVTPRQALEVLKFNGIYYRYSKKTKYLYVSTVQEHLTDEYGKIEEEDFTIKHADVSDMETILTSLLSPKGRIVADPRTAQILVWDTRDNLDEMKQTVARLDVPLEPKIFHLKYVDADSLLDSIQSMLTERGLAQADPRSNSLVITDLPSRMNQIGEMIKALDQKLETRTWTLNYADPKDISERIENLVPEEMGTISVDKERHQLSVTAIPTRLDEINNLIKAWDVKPREVQIEAYLVTAQTSVARNLGINWSYFGNKGKTPFALQVGPKSPSYSATGPTSGQQLTLGNLPYQIPLLNPLTHAVVRDINGNAIPNPAFQGDNVGAVLDYLATQGEVRVLSHPRVMVEDGQQATFENTQDIPYQNGGYSQYSAAVQASNATSLNTLNPLIPLQVQFVTVGTILKVKPRISEDGNIMMEISAEDSTADTVTVTTGNQNSTIPEKHQNKAESQVLAHNGETIVIGGMRAASINDNVDKLPILGDVPFLGRLFRNTKKNHQDSELMIFLTATIVNGMTGPEAKRLTPFEEGVTDTMRRSEESAFERVESDLTGGRNEIGVSIGRRGAIYSEGQFVTLDDLKAEFAKVKRPKHVKVIIRTHPDAPPGLQDKVERMAKDAGLRVMVDTRDAPPAVPIAPLKASTGKSK